MSICMFMARYMYKVWSSYHATYAERKDDDERWIGEFSVLDYACFQVDDRTSSLNPALHPVLGNVNDVYSIQSRIIRHFFFLFFFVFFHFIIVHILGSSVTSDSIAFSVCIHS